MLTVPLQAVPSQKLTTVIANQIIDLRIYQLRYGLYIDVYVNNVLEIGAVVCENLNRIIRNSYLNDRVSFEGDFVFNDVEGNTDPVFTGLGSRYQLLYVTQAELDALGLTQ